ncbi:hypothetical protein Taro_049529 [Colocasia esculenta]|uniref:Uncharacterized protein n=1 Tax=Colocasia esculenta TaxID=4460 RepID=A0A843XBC0_COLES|nr:hypothetical protein [Colocasia esculenta]
MERDNDHVLRKSDNMSALEKSKSRSSSSSSGYSTEDDFIQFDASELRSPNTRNEHIHSSNLAPPPDVRQEAQLASDVRTQGGEIAGTNPFASEFGGGDKADTSGKSSLHGVKQSPATQVMVRPDVPDSGRIPSSIFERSKSTTPVEWSVASNESLFSINGGNSSFSRDHVFLLDRSGELPNFSNSPPVAYPPISTASGPAEKTLGMGHGLEQSVTAEAANAEAMKDVLRAAADEKEKPSIRGIQHSDSASRHSDASNQSFAFPILTQGRSASVKVEPQQQLQATTQQQLKAEDQKDQSDQKKAPEPTANAPQGNCFSCCSCSSCF